MNCMTCKHYYVTWNPALPKGCHLYHTQSVAFPSVLVKEAIGDACPGYNPKKIKSDVIEKRNVKKEENGWHW